MEKYLQRAYNLGINFPDKCELELIVLVLDKLINEAKQENIYIHYSELFKEFSKGYNHTEKYMDIIKIPCKTGDTVWFIDQWGRSASWGKVIAFTETHIIVDTAFTEYRKYKEFLPISEWNISIFISNSNIDNSEDVKKHILTNVGDRENYYKIKGFQCRELSMRYYRKEI